MKKPALALGFSSLNLERETGFEPATSTLARSHSTTELLPLVTASLLPDPSQITLGISAAGSRFAHARKNASSYSRSSVLIINKPLRHSNAGRFSMLQYAQPVLDFCM